MHIRTATKRSLKHPALAEASLIVMALFTALMLFGIEAETAAALGPSVEATCDDKGVLTVLRRGQQTGIVEAKTPGGDWFPVRGSWKTAGRRMQFVSDDMQLVLRSQYEVKLTSYGGESLGSAKTICPGLRFSCKVAEWNLNECSRLNNDYVIRFTADAIDSAEDLIYYATDEKGKKLIRSQDIRNNALEGFTVMPLAHDEYVVTFSSDDVISSFAITHGYCDEKNEPYYQYESIPCDISRCETHDDCRPIEQCNAEDGLCTSLRCDHCSYNHSCYDSFATLDINSEPYYCSANNIFERQKNDGASCFRDEECIGNCIDRVCVPIITEEPDDDAVAIMPEVEAPSPPSYGFLQVLKTVAIVIAVFLMLLSVIRYPLPALGRRFLEQKKRGEEYVLKQWHGLLNENIKKEKARLGFS